MRSRNHDYSDIIDLPHPVSKRHPQMSMRDRAAQFSPFAALTGHDDAIKETARLTDAQMELDETIKEGLDNKLMLILEHAAEKPMVTITYFQKDEKKAGGSYESVQGIVYKVDFYERVLVLEDRRRIRLDDVVALDSHLFDGL